MKYFIYARKSTDDEERQILSIDSQLDELRMLATREKLEVVREYVESQTAKKPGRPIFNAMLKAIKKGEAQGIVAWHPDRLARNSVDGGRLIYDLDTGRLAALKFPTFWFENTPQGKFMLNIAFGQSKYYVDNLSENIKRGLRKKLRDGIFPNKPPIGYINDPKTRAVIVDPERAPLVVKMFEAYATGRYTSAQIKELVTAWGLRTFNGLTLPLSKVLWTLDHIFYTGVFRFNGEIYEGKHTPLISRELYQRVQEIRRNAGRGRYAKHNRHPFRGMIFCHECGCQFTVDSQKGHNYYRCGKRRGPCDIKTIREEALAELLRAAMCKVSIPDSDADKMLKEMTKRILADREEQAALVERQKARLAEVGTLQDRLLDVFLAGDIEREEFTARKERYMQEKATLAAAIAKFEAEGASRLKPVVDFITASRQAKYDARSKNSAELRIFFQKYGANLIFAVRNLAEERGAPQAALPPDGCGSQGGSGDSPPPIPVPRGGSAARSACPNPPQNGSFSFAADPEAPFIPILPQDVAAVAPAGKPFRSLGSKSDPILHIRFARPWAIVAQYQRKNKWRRERDSNPRPACAGSGFQDRRDRPLRHLSTSCRFNQRRP